MYLKSISFSKALLVGSAVALPIILGVVFNFLEIGLAIGFGAFWSSPSDVSGSFKQKRNGILLSAVLITIISFIGGYLHYEKWISFFVLGILSFCIALISVYGFRASLISFSGLLALVLSFALTLERLEIYQYALLVGLGGIWYLLLTTLWHKAFPKAETEEFLTETYLLTAKFLETRGKLADFKADTKRLQKELLDLQAHLTENHSTLREILILSRKSSGPSNYEDQKLLVFVQLIEMLENAIANPAAYERMQGLFKDHPQYITKFQSLNFEMAAQLRKIARAGSDPKKLPNNENLISCFANIKTEIEFLEKGLLYGDYILLQNFLDYQEKQYEKLKRIKWLLDDPNPTEIGTIDRKTARRFVAFPEYDPMLLVRNLSFNSNIFRHALRLSVTLMTGYALGSVFPFQNPYWILLTIIVIMRPSYGLTKSRSIDRIVGTLIGVVIAVGLVFVIQNPYIFAILGIGSLVVAFSMTQKNNKTSAVFITLSVIFIYAILEPNVLGVIKFRLIDTVVGAALSYLAMRILWPTWESVSMRKSIEKSVQANQIFLQKIIAYYLQKGKLPTSYALARKRAFLETSNLNSAFQRMAQEPKSKQREIDKIYEMVVLNHSFLASLASLGTYVQHHKTTDVSPQFKTAAHKIETALTQILKCLQGNDCSTLDIKPEAQYVFEEDLLPFSTEKIKGADLQGKMELRNLQEKHLVWEQLKWQFAMSGKMLHLVNAVRF